MITSNALTIAQRFANRVQQLQKAAAQGLLKAAVTVDREQVKLLSGSGAPGVYPVPVRKGTLRGGHFYAITGTNTAVVGDTTVYAAKIHRTRPFLDDAVKKANPQAIVMDTMSKAIFS